MMAGQRWVRLDVDYFQNPKIRAVSRDARTLHLASILHAGRYLTDGQIADRSLTDVSQMADITSRWALRRARELEVGGLWIRNGAGWHLHDFESMNPQAMKEIVERDRAAWRARQTRWRDRHKGDVTA